MILERGHPEFDNLPGIAILIGGMWIANLYYWGFNQYIIQRTLAAKSLKEAQKGIAFAAFLKLIIPLIVVVPGIIAYVMYAQPEGTAVIDGAREAFIKSDGAVNYDKAYPWLIGKFVPIGLKGVVVASPSVLAVSMIGLFWKKVTTRGAIWGAILSIPVALILKIQALGLPFMDQMLYTFIITIVISGMISLSTNENDDDPKGFIITKKLFTTDKTFNIASYVIVLILALLYTIFW